MTFSTEPGSVNAAYNPRYWVAEELPRQALAYFRTIPIVDARVAPVIVMRTRFVLPIKGAYG